MAHNRTALISLIGIVTTILALVASIILAIAVFPAWSSTALVLVLSIATLSLGLLQTLSWVREVKEEKKTPKRPSSVKITLEIDREPVTIEASDISQVEEVLKLAQRFQNKYPPGANLERKNASSNPTVTVAGDDTTADQKLKVPDLPETNMSPQEQSEDLSDSI